MRWGIVTTLIVYMFASSVLAQTVVDFTLVNAESDQDISILSDNHIINLDGMPQMSVRANTNPAVVGSVQFELRKNGSLQFRRTENQAPYALFGDNNGDYGPWFAPGPEAGVTYSLIATPYSLPHLQGDRGPSIYVAFHTEPIPDAFFVSPLPNSNLSCIAPVHVEVLAPSAKLLTLHIDGNQVGQCPCNGPYLWDLDTTCHANGEHEISVIVYDENCDPGEPIKMRATFANAGFVDAFHLIDATNDTAVSSHDGQDVLPMPNHSFINIDQLPLFSVQTLTAPSSIGSVKVELWEESRKLFERTENQPPYALFGDNNGDYGPWFGSGPKFGKQYQVRAIPYSEPNAQGASGLDGTVFFTVIRDMSVSKFAAINALQDQPIPGHDPLINGASISLSQNPELTVAVETSPQQVGSVRMILTKNSQAIVDKFENILPYALFGDDDGNYNKWINPQVGLYELTVIPYSGILGTGADGPASSITFNLTN